MASRKSRPPSDVGDSPSPRAPPPSGRDQRGRYSDDEFYRSSKKKRRHSGRGYDLGKEKSPKVDLLFCVFQGAPSHRWRTAPYSFDRRKINDVELWEDIRAMYRGELQKPWRRIFGFTKLKHIIPIEVPCLLQYAMCLRDTDDWGRRCRYTLYKYTPNSVPIPKGDPKSNPNSHSFMHAYHHPDRLRPEHEWVDWFIDFKAQDPGKTVGLEFQQGLWAEKLGLIAVIITIAIIVASIVWCLKGGDLQTVFTVMGFVLTLAAAEVALVGLYFQVTQSN